MKSISSKPADHAHRRYRSPIHQESQDLCWLSLSSCTQSKVSISWSHAWQYWKFSAGSHGELTLPQIPLWKAKSQSAKFSSKEICLNKLQDLPANLWHFVNEKKIVSRIKCETTPSPILLHWKQDILMSIFYCTLGRSTVLWLNVTFSEFPVVLILAHADRRHKLSIAGAAVKTTTTTPLPVSNKNSGCSLGK